MSVKRFEDTDNHQDLFHGRFLPPAHTWLGRHIDLSPQVQAGKI